jgi:hypothetical protein
LHSTNNKGNSDDYVLKPKFNPVIERTAQIDKSNYNSIKETQKNFENFVDLIQLTKFTKTLDEENTVAKKIQEKPVVPSKPSVPHQIQQPGGGPKNFQKKFPGVANKDIKKDNNNNNKKKFYNKNNNNKDKLGKASGNVKDKEKLKRKKGQSTHATWKPEAFMKLRQQFD